MKGRKKVHCEAHGTSIATFVCQHLATDSGVGFFWAETPGDPYPDAWCRKCERVRIREGGDWNEASEAFAEITLICHHCYEAARARNE